jgi:prevent-host-death family protein
VPFAAESPNKAYRYLQVREGARDAIEAPLQGMNKRELSERDICTKFITPVPHMERIGIRALRQHASAVLRRVERGEALEVTARSRPIALLTPPYRRALDALRATGRADAADADLLDLDPPPAPGPATPSG